MAMMSFPRELPVDVARLATMALGVEAVQEWIETAEGRRPSGNQAKDEDTGLPLWQIGVMFNPIKGGDALGTAMVSIPSTMAPDVTPGQPVEFEGLQAEIWAGRKGLGGRFVATGTVGAKASRSKASEGAAA